jgi:ABC-type methionine transport system permease subunit
MERNLSALVTFRLMQVRDTYMNSQVQCRRWIFNNSDKIMFAAGVGLIVSAVPTVASAQGDMDQDSINQVIQILLNDMIGGSFGALIMIIAGLVAIISASMGAYRASMSALVVAVGAFILKAVVTAFWPQVDVG